MAASALSASSSGGSTSSTLPSSSSSSSLTALPPTYDELRAENERLRARIAQLEAAAATSAAVVTASTPATISTSSITASPSVIVSSSSSSSDQNGKPMSGSSSSGDDRKWVSELKSDDILRYSRQLLISEVGVVAQKRFASSRVLIVGAGGLGAPIALYLAAAGIGHIGIVDPDVVELNNLHRQVIHSEATVGIAKAISARDACRRLNSSIQVTAYVTRFDEDNAMELVSLYDIIVDATDNVATRYLINDSAILSRRIVVSGSALRMEGQLTVYGYKGGPCYRCLYPQPPPPETVTNCSDGGVLGIVPGIIGCLQALEILKIAGSLDAEVMSQRMLLFDGMSASTLFRSFKLRPRDPKCAVCGDNPTVTKLINYTQFCSSTGLHDKSAIGIEGATGDAVVSLSARRIAELRNAPSASPSTPSAAVVATTTTPTVPPSSGSSSSPPHAHVLLDVRVPEQHAIASLPGAINIPLRDLRRRLPELFTAIQNARTAAATSLSPEQPLPVYVMCRRGVDSMTATRLLRTLSIPTPTSAAVTTTTTPTTTTPAVGAWQAYNMSGGLLAWTRHVDPSFPVY